MAERQGSLTDRSGGRIEYRTKLSRSYRLKCIRLFADRIMKTLHIPCDPGEISDGYHTFNELYDHRCTLFLALMASNPALSWISAKHHDGSEWEGWFIAGMELPTGDVTYHLPNSMMGAAMQTGCRVLDCGKEWDGHTAADVVKRLREWARSANA